MSGNTSYWKKKKEIFNDIPKLTRPYNQTCKSKQIILNAIYTLPKEFNYKTIKT